MHIEHNEASMNKVKKGGGEKSDSWRERERERERDV
jgi:hypothetical protein